MSNRRSARIANLVQQNLRNERPPPRRRSSSRQPPQRQRVRSLPPGMSLPFPIPSPFIPPSNVVITPRPPPPRRRPPPPRRSVRIQNQGLQIANDLREQRRLRRDTPPRGRGRGRVRARIQQNWGDDYSENPQQQQQRQRFDLEIPLPPSRADVRIIPNQPYQRLVRRRNPALEILQNALIHSPHNSTITVPSVNLNVLQKLIIPSNRGLILEYNGQYFTITTKSLQNINQRLNSFLFDSNPGDYPGELLDIIARGNGVLTFRIMHHRRISGRGRRSIGAYFPFLNEQFSAIDLKRYGVYSTLQEEEEHCLVIAARHNPLFNANDINLILLAVNSRPFPRNHFKELASTLCCNINLITDSTRTSFKWSSPEWVKHWSIAQIKDHYFIQEITLYTPRNLSHYDDFVRNPRNFPNTVQYLSSFALIKRMHDSFTPIHIDAQTSFFNVDHHLKPHWIVQNIDPSCCIPIENKTRPDHFDAVCYFDIETDTQSESYHTPFCVAWEWSEEELNTPERQFLIIDRHEDSSILGFHFLKHLYDQLFEQNVLDQEQGVFKILLIAHNASYDLQLLLDHCRPLSMLKDGNRVKSWNGRFYRYSDMMKKTHYLDITLHDSYLMIASKLSAFPKMFNLNVEKEWFPYDLYTTQRLETHPFIHQSEIPIDVLSMFEEKGWMQSNQLDMFTLAEFYCSQDVRILKQGFETFRKWILDFSGLDVFHHITLSHISKNYMIQQKCFEGVYALKSHVLHFIRQCVYGGRCMCSNNQSSHHTTPIEDQDVNSLYPTAMIRMDGFLLGTPKPFENEEHFLSNANTLDGYFVEIQILHVDQHRTFPTLCDRSTQTLNWTNDMEGKYMFVCKTTLEDLVRYHQIEYKFIQGYYYNEGFNTHIRRVIQFLYTERMRLKEQGNPAQLVYKLLMNSCYGVTLIRPIETKLSFVKNEDFEKFYMRNHPFITQVYDMGSLRNMYEKYHYKVVEQVKPPLSSSSMPHLGSEILAWSKRIMNEIIYLAEDKNIHIHYTDTDSIHMDQSGVIQLGILYEQQFNRSLFGIELGQMSSDFHDKSYAIESYFLLKKVYLDVLNDGTFHYTMKGVTQAAVLAWCQEENVDLPTLYRQLYEGNTITFHNGKNADGSSKATFRRNKNGLYSPMEESFLLKRISINK